MAVMSICIISIIALANRNYMFARLVFVLWPFVLVTTAVRAAVMSKCGRAAGLPLHVDADHNSRLSAVQQYSSLIASRTRSSGSATMAVSSGQSLIKLATVAAVPPCQVACAHLASTASTSPLCSRFSSIGSANCTLTSSPGGTGPGSSTSTTVSAQRPLEPTLDATAPIAKS